MSTSLKPGYNQVVDKVWDAVEDAVLHNITPLEFWDIAEDAFIHAWAERTKTLREELKRHPYTGRYSSEGSDGKTE